MIFRDDNRKLNLSLMRWIRWSCILAAIYQLLLLASGMFGVYRLFSQYKTYGDAYYLARTITETCYTLGYLCITALFIHAMLRLNRALKPEGAGPLTDMPDDVRYWLKRYFILNVTGLLFSLLFAGINMVLPFIFRQA